MADYIIMNKIAAYIGTELTGSGGTATWTYKQLGAGIDNISEAMNEVVQQYQFMAGEGYATNHVTGAAPAWTFTGKRVFGDEAQDYIFSKKYSFDDDRSSSFKLEYKDDADETHTITVPCTICNIQEFGGAATDDASISFEIRFDGAPTVT